jgi:hypothetical protein
MRYLIEADKKFEPNSMQFVVVIESDALRLPIEGRVKAKLR